MGRNVYTNKASSILSIFLVVTQKTITVRVSAGRRLDQGIKKDFFSVKQQSDKFYALDVTVKTTIFETFRSVLQRGKTQDDALEEKSFYMMPHIIIEIHGNRRVSMDGH